jgi:hypothetical protein
MEIDIVHMSGENEIGRERFKAADPNNVARELIDWIEDNDIVVQPGDSFVIAEVE